MTVRQAATPEEFDAGRALFREHAEALGEHFCFIGFDDELASAHEQYSPPGGLLLLALEGNTAVGCVAYRDKGDGACEMKRMFLRPEARGRGAGRLLAETLVQRAREAGFRRMVLDTLPTMVAAHAMYLSMGFLPTEPYNENPIPGVTFFLLDL